MKPRSCKVVVLGESDVGKSTLLHRCLTKEFISDIKTTVGVDVMVLVRSVDGVEVELHVWDTAGQERFNAVTPQLYRSAGACILVCDLTSPESVRKLGSWCDNLVQLGGVDLVQGYPMMILANKSDEDAVVTDEDLAAVEKQHHCKVFKVSAKTGDNLDAAMDHLARLIVDFSRIMVEPVLAAPSMMDENRCCK